MTFKVSPAQQNESLELAKIMDHASRSDSEVGLDYFAWSQQADSGQDPYEIGAEIIAGEDSDYTYKNMRVVDVDGNVSGLALAYPIREITDEDIKNSHFLFRVFSTLKQQVEGYYYLDSIAVLPETRGSGIGKLLMNDFMEQAKFKGFKNICLLAFEDNVRAIKLYENLGFKSISRAPVEIHIAMPYSCDVLLFTKSLKKSLA